MQSHLASPVALLTALILASCASMEPGTDISTAWKEGRAFTPESDVFLSPEAIPPMTRQYPVVIFMHGCTGIDTAEMSWAPFLRELGFVVVVPNSLARRDRGPSCDGSTAQYYGSHTTHRLRQQEIDYALGKVMAAAWAKKGNVFLMGHSEGGIAAARTKHADFRGIIISGWTRTTKYDGYAGIYSPKTVPVLSILWTSDRWYPSGHTSGTCEASLAGRAKSHHVSLDGFNHNTFPSPVAREAVKKFLQENALQ